jgi:protein TonB
MAVVLFEGLGAAGRRRRLPTLLVSTGVHAVVLLAALVLSIMWPPETPPLRGEAIRVSLEGPPPPPPPPLPKGSDLVERPAQRRPAPSPSPATVASHVLPVVEETPLLATEASPEQAGSETGSELGVPEGMEGGVPGGVIGGVPGGVLGGVLGGTGTVPIPVTDYDQPARIVRKTKPTYPREAFVAKIQGIVLVEFIIDTSGQVVQARVAQSIPALDAAALDAVRQWLFTPAQQRGRPVATLAIAPVEFRIF